MVASQVSPVPAGTLRLDYTDMTVQIGQGLDLNSMDKLRELKSLPQPASRNCRIWPPLSVPMLSSRSPPPMANVSPRSR